MDSPLLRFGASLLFGEQKLIAANEKEATTLAGVAEEEGAVGPSLPTTFIVNFISFPLCLL
jgi:hypothetical protein